MHSRTDNGNSFMRANRAPLTPREQAEQAQIAAAQAELMRRYQPQNYGRLFDDFLAKRRMTMAGKKFKTYRKKQLAEMRPYEEGEDLAGVSISDQDAGTGSPKPGDMIARNPENHDDQWLVSAKFFNANYEPF